jgi:opacity protein-like surface antigen
MKKLLISAACLAMLTACSSAPRGFGPAYGGDFGYHNTQIEQDRFRVSYTSRNDYESRDFALLRAAQIAQNEGFTHFQIVGGDAYSNGPNLIGAGVGLGGGRHHNSHIDVGVSDVVRAVEGYKVTETIEVILLSNPPSKDPSIFAAESIIRNIVPPKMANAGQPKQKTP